MLTQHFWYTRYSCCSGLRYSLTVETGTAPLSGKEEKFIPKRVIRELIKELGRNGVLRGKGIVGGGGGGGGGSELEKNKKNS